MAKGWTEYDLAEIERKPGYAVTHQLGDQETASVPEAVLAMALDIDGAPPFEREYRFHPPRKWRFDFAWPSAMFAVEVEGITYDGGRHQRVAGFEKDCEKYEVAMLDGWTVYRVTPKRVQSGAAVAAIRQMLAY